MPIALDNHSTDVFSGGTGPFTLSHTVSGTDRLLVVMAYGMDNVTTEWAWNTPTFNGVSMTYREAIFAAGNNRNVLITLWTMTNPPTGTNTVSVTPSTGILDAAVAAISLTGVDQTTPVGNSNSYSATPATAFSTSITTGTADAWLVGGGAIRNGTLTWSPDDVSVMTELFDITGGTSTTDDISSFGSYRTTKAAGTYAFAVTASGSNNGVIAAIAVNAAASGVARQMMYYARMHR